MITAGIDVGSRTLKVVLYDTDTRRVLVSAVEPQGVKQAELARRIFDRLAAGRKLARRDLAAVIATGYGRDAVTFADATVTEISCHAAGVRSVAPDARTVVDIGGQDSKIVRLDADGAVRDFAINDRCAAGTGRFLELVASRLEVTLGDLGALAARAQAPAPISSMCAVFAETEIIGLLSSGETPENIVAGVQTAIASRIVSLAGRRVEEPVVFTGGVALVSGMDRALARALGCAVRVAPTPQLTGALGAAILAQRRALTSR